jgi:proteasome accessory factor B
VQPRLAAEEPSFEAFWDATRTRTAVGFDYRRSSATTVSRRHLEPWGVVSFRGRWYVVGHDTDRGEPRLFRLSRVHGEVRTEGKPGAFEVPAGTDLRALTASLAPAAPERSATLRVRPGAAQGLRRHARPADVPAEAGWERVRVAYAHTDRLADEVLAYGADVVVEEPADLRAAVVERLRGSVGASR